MSIYLSTLLVSLGLSAFFGLVLAAADAALSNYGECDIVINGEKTVTVPGGDALLGSLFAKKYFIPSACGGKGTCGYCKVKLPGSPVSLLPTEKMVLTPAEAAEGWRLACQIKVKGAMAVDMPEEYFLIREYETAVERTEIIATDIREIVLKLSDPDRISFKPGQYVQVMIPSKPGPVHRSYSIASCPSMTDRVVLNIKLEQGGLASTWLHERKVGDKVTISGPYGDFLFKGASRGATMVAGGVGLAPIASILSDLLGRDPGRRINLFFKVKTEDEFYYLSTIEEWKSRWPGFTCHLVVSDIPETEGFDKGPRGRITKVMEPLMDRLRDDEFYLCGAPVMINGLMEFFDTQGIPRERIAYDKFE